MKRLHTRVGVVRLCGFRAIREGAIWLAVASGTALLCGASASTVSGNIQNAAGKPIRAAITLHDLSTPRVAGQTPFDHQFASKGDGSFSLVDVPAGKYEICVEAPQENVLDPCVWSLSPQTVTVSGSAPVTGVAVKVQTGYRLQIRVNDAQALLPPPSGGIAGDALSLMAISSRSRYVNFRLLARDNAGRDQYLLVPFNEPLIVVAASSQFALSDGSGTRLTNDAERIPVVVPPGKSYPPITLNVAKR